MQARLGTIVCKFGPDSAICLQEEAIFVKLQMFPYHVIFDLDLDLEHTLLGTIVCKFGGDPAISVVEVAICAKKFTDGQTDDGRLAIA